MSLTSSYAFKATDKLKITPGAQYWSDLRTGNTFDSGLDKWRAGLTLDYAITEGLATRVSVQYEDTDTVGGGSNDEVKGFVRLQRNF
ncbi:Outer membrane protein IIIA [Ensifer adhaerens]|uniref:porin n=1 Tax=Ensifer adhaerens TaxID=106592 RepID=UPI00156A45D8|nr:porin [Ensifer adhaerens]NRP21404.1 Outer membrane protein IIIA [Ensifer adhaerens]